MLRHNGNLTLFFQLQIGTCHLPLQGLNHMLLQVLIFNNPWKEFKVESRNEALCALGKTGRTSLQIVIFRSWFYEPNSWISPRKGPKILHGSNCSFWLAKLHKTSRNLLEKNVLDCMYSPFILPQIKLNSQLLCCAFFKSTVNDIFVQAHTHTNFYL